MLTSSSTPFSLPDRVVQISLDEDRTPTSVDWDSLSNIAEYLLIAIFSCAHSRMLIVLIIHCWVRPVVKFFLIIV